MPTALFTVLASAFHSLGPRALPTSQQSRGPNKAVENMSYFKQNQI